uniref:Uncharacterized protein n=1 Tax=Nelumbo nucifera TaxID=4432 RepID=A0A822Z840_NELNU|nr:TPA_asm: hypothetical protein HUJ06_013968 [Nelumbo nucifera]
MGTVPPYKLVELSSKYCWTVSKQMVFSEGEEENYPENLVKIGRNVVEKHRGGLPPATKIKIGDHTSAPQHIPVVHWEHLLMQTSSILVLSSEDVPNTRPTCFVGWRCDLINVPQHIPAVHGEHLPMQTSSRFVLSSGDVSNTQ